MATPEFLYIGKVGIPVEGRCSEVCKDFNYQYLQMKDVDELSDADSETQQAPFCLLSALDTGLESTIAGQVQVIRQFLGNTYIAVVVDSRMESEKLSFIKKSGANLVLLEREVHETSKVEYAVSQKLRSSYWPVKISEIRQGTSVYCNLYHLMPLNRKWLPVLRPDQVVDEARLKKLNALGVSEVYVRREDAKFHQKYVEENPDLSAKGLASRCRAQFLSFMSSYTDLVLLIMDQSEIGSFQAGKSLYDNCVNFSSVLMGSLGAIGEAWEIINNTSVGEFGSVERAPAVAAYAGLMSLLSSIGEPKDIMIACLLADVGMLELHPKITRKIRVSGLSSLNPEEQVDYEKHPLISLNRSLSRKLPISESIKNAIMNTHERMDGKGFPGQLRPERIPAEAKLIQLAEMIDRESVVRMGEKKPDIREVRKRIFDREFENPKIFDMAFLMQLKDQMVQ